MQMISYLGGPTLARDNLSACEASLRDNANGHPDLLCPLGKMLRPSARWQILVERRNQFDTSAEHSLIEALPRPFLESLGVLFLFLPRFHRQTYFAGDPAGD